MFTSERRLSWQGASYQALLHFKQYPPCDWPATLRFFRWDKIVSGSKMESGDKMSLWHPGRHYERIGSILLSKKKKKKRGSGVFWGIGPKGYARYKCFSSGKASSDLRLHTIHSQIVMLTFLMCTSPWQRRSQILFPRDYCVVGRINGGRVSQTCEAHRKALSSLEDSKACQRTHGHHQMLGSLTVITGILLSGPEEELIDERKEESSFTKSLRQKSIPRCS